MKPLFATDAPTSPVGFVDITKQQQQTVPVVAQRQTTAVVVADADIDQIGSRVGGHAAKTAQQILASVKASDVD